MPHDQPHRSTQPPKPKAGAAPTPTSTPASSSASSTKGQTLGARGAQAARWIITHRRTSGISAIATALLWWVFIFIPASPSWAIWSLASALNHHRGKEAAAYVDFESITRDLLNQGIKAQVAKDAGQGKDSPGKLLGQAIAKQLGGLVAGPLADTVKVRFEQEVSDPKKGEHVGLSELIGAIWHLHRTGDTAVTSGTDDKGQRVELTLVRGATGWRITRVSGDAVRRKLEEAARKSSDDAAPSLREMLGTEPPKHEL